MADPTIPVLRLANDESAMGIGTQDTYGLPLEIDAPDPWLYVPVGRFPDYTPQIVISMLVGDTATAALCAPEIAAEIEFTVPPTRISMSAGTYDSPTKTYSRVSSITPDTSDVVIGTTTPLVIEMTNITPNDVAGAAKITLTPRLKARSGTGKTDITGTALAYTVEKTRPPVVIADVNWSLGDQPGNGKLTWTTTGDVQTCIVRANGEPINEQKPSRIDPAYSAYSASLILESGTQSVTITAVDPNHNTTRYSQSFNFHNFNPYFKLQVSNGRPLSLVLSDQTSVLYGMFEDPKSTAWLWSNDLSGTQDNWQNTHVVLPAGAETSQCVYYDGRFFLVGGSIFDPAGFGRDLHIYRDNTWQPIEAPAAWSEPMIGRAVTLFQGAIWVAGGYGSSAKVYDDVYSYTQTGDNAGTWTPQPGLPQPLCNASLASVGGNLYLYGGYLDMPGGSAVTDLYVLKNKKWENQHKDPVGDAPDYWTIGGLGDALMLLGSFGGKAFTGRLTTDPHWQGGDANLANVIRPLPTQPPYGLTTASYKGRLFLVMTDTDAKSAFAYYEPPDTNKRPSRN